MEKKYIIGGLAVLGGLALIAYLRKPKRNSEGFFNATGTQSRNDASLLVLKNEKSGQRKNIDKN